MAPRKPKDMVYATFTKDDDLELHVKTTALKGPLTKKQKTVVQIREYVPSLKRYGRGVTFDVRHLKEVRSALDHIEAVYSTDGEEA